MVVSNCRHGTRFQRNSKCTFCAPVCTATEEGYRSQLSIFKLEGKLFALYFRFALCVAILFGSLVQNAGPQMRRVAPTLQRTYAILQAQRISFGFRNGLPNKGPLSDSLNGEDAAGSRRLTSRQHVRDGVGLIRIERSHSPPIQSTDCIPASADMDVHFGGSPTGPGLLHMAEQGEEEAVVPTGALDFSTYRGGTRTRSKDVEREPAQDGEVLGGIVHSRPVAVLVEVDVEHPVQLVLDGPMTARDLQQSLGGHGTWTAGSSARPAARRVCPATACATDAADRNDAWEAVDGSQAGIAHDGCPARFAPVVGGRCDRLDGAALAGPCKLPDHGLEQRSTIGLDRQHVVATAIEHGLGHRTMAMRRIGRDAASTAKTLTMCRGSQREPRSKARPAAPCRRLLQAQKQPQQVFLGLSKLRHVRAGLCSAQDRGQGDNPAMKRRNAASKASGSSKRNTRLKVS